MTVEELRTAFAEDAEWGWAFGADCPDAPTPDGIIIINRRLETAAHFSPVAFAARTLQQLQAETVRGLDVDHITRVTGYFSKTSGWNQGKKAELKDRRRGLDAAEE